MRRSLVLTAAVLVSTITGCGGSRSSEPENPATIDALTSTVGKQNEIDQWNAYTPAEQDEYRQAFDLCNGWVTTGADTFDLTGKKAPDYLRAHEGASADGCGDGIAGLPLAGSGVPVPP